MFLTPDLVLTAYQQGYFPMAEPDGEMYWHCPDPRAVIPLTGNVRVSRSLRRTIAKGIYTIRFNTDFDGVIRGCAERSETWISDEIIEVYSALHELGFAHSVEAWYADAPAETSADAPAKSATTEGTEITRGAQGTRGYERLVGGLYGVAVGGAFFGESMFSTMTDASKVAFVRLVEHLYKRRFLLLDSQYLNPHMESLGAIEVPRELFLHHLGIATKQRRNFV
jgi:leucyl/phenylalanyl-tRNA---protein transferase